MNWRPLLSVGQEIWCAKTHNRIINATPGDVHAARNPAQNGRSSALRKIVIGAEAHLSENAP
jgi:hypothetical protein